MEFRKVNAYIERFDSLVRQERTGTAFEFAQKMGVTDRTLRSHLQQLRDLGVLIEYDRWKRTYKYLEEGQLVFCFIKGPVKSIKDKTKLTELFPSETFTNN